HPALPAAVAGPVGDVAAAQPEPVARASDSRRGPRRGGAARDARARTAARTVPPSGGDHQAVLPGHRRHRALEQRRGANHSFAGSARRDIGLRRHSARVAQSLRPDAAGDHHHLHARHAVGGLRCAKRRDETACARPDRRKRMGRTHQTALRGAAAGDIRMSATVFAWSLIAAQVLLALAMGFAITRILRGPRAQDRVLGLDTLYVNAMLLLVTFGVRSGSTIYFEAALVIALLGFEIGRASCRERVWIAGVVRRHEIEG